MNRSRDRRTDADVSSDHPNFNARREALLEAALLSIITTELTDPRLLDLEVLGLEWKGGGTVVRVHYRHADLAQAAQALAAATGFVQARLAERLPRRRAITVRFLAAAPLPKGGEP